MSARTLSIQKCASYEQIKVKEAIIKLLEPLGGIKAFVRSGNKVLIKPNMLTCKEPERAATTHPAVIEAVASLCHEAGATVLIGDSPPAVFGRTEEFWEKTGFAAAARNSGAQLTSFETDAKVPVKFFSNGREITVHLVKTLFLAD
ncbi:MAG TPA: DUF362 domain-containing protein, partial [Candidatus Rifleibacterium sp.]|nr:DUF362 domain-containing protein [Candidatus Rifleibacterium sp.]